MALFVSYSSQDRSTVDALAAALRRAQQQVWFDQELGGGDSWWAKILEQIRACDLFLVALSSNWLQSKTESVRAALRAGFEQADPSGSHRRHRQHARESTCGVADHRLSQPDR